MAEEAAPKEEKKKEKGGRSGKIVRKPKKPVNNWKKYKAEGDTLKRSNNSCPKCGPGIFLAAHKNRAVCGKCGYVEMAGKNEPKKDSK